MGLKKSSEREHLNHSNKHTNRNVRQGFLAGLVGGLVPIVALLLLGSGPPGDTRDKALFIDENGRIGVGTGNPQTALDIKSEGGIRISRTEPESESNEIFFQDNGQIRSRLERT